MKILKSVFNLGICLLLLFACNKELKKASKAQNPLPFMGLYRPVLLEPDTSKLVLSDYVYADPDKVKITLPEGIQYTRNGDTLRLTGTLATPIAPLTFTYKGKSASVLLKKANKQLVTITANNKNTRIKGDFNAWNVNSGVLGNENQISFKLAPGKYQYLFVSEGKEIRDPNNPDSVSNGMGGWNSVLTIHETASLSVPELSASLTENTLDLRWNGVVSQLYILANNSVLLASELNSEDTSHSVSLDLLPTHFENGHLQIIVSNEQRISNTLLIPVKKNTLVTSASELDRSDLYNNSLYFIMTDRFFNGNTNNDGALNLPTVLPQADYQGGDVSGITEKINKRYFQSLGINTIWISPITQNPETAYGFWPEPKTAFSGYHGYWPISSTKVDHRYGTKKELKTMLATAHEEDMNVLLDYVANHVHEDHPIYQNNKDWATNLYLPDGSLNTERWDDQRLTTWFDTFLPTLDLRKDEVVAPMTDSAMYWLKEYDFDGFRHDATKHIPLKFWRTLTKKVKTQIVAPQNRTIFQIGETYGSRALIASYINSGMLDAQFDFNLYDDAVHTFATPEGDMHRLMQGLSASIEWYGDHHLMGNISGNQDRARFISYADGSVKFEEDAKKAGWTREINIQDSLAYDKLALLHAFNFTIPGVPVIYYGDEIGLPGGNDPDNRRNMVFDSLTSKQLVLRNTVSELGNLRSNRIELQYGRTKFYAINNKVGWIMRSYLGQHTLMIMNTAQKAHTVSLSEILSTDQYTIHSGKPTKGNSLTIAPVSFEIITIN